MIFITVFISPKYLSWRAFSPPSLPSCSSLSTVVFLGLFLFPYTTPVYSSSENILVFDHDRAYLYAATIKWITDNMSYLSQLLYYTIHFKYQILCTCKRKSTPVLEGTFSLWNEWYWPNMSYFQSLRVNTF